MIKLDSILTLSKFTPKSTNNLYFCLYIDENKRRIIVKDDWYRDWRAFFTAILPDGFLPNDVSNIGLYIEVGIMEEFDVDNTLKGIIDALQFRYGFNDNQLKSLIAKKIPTRKLKRHGVRENYKGFDSLEPYSFIENINILDSSISKNEIENTDAKKYEEKTIFKYELFFLVEYELYDDSGFLKANTTVETSRSTTSQKYISLNETEIIINDLLFQTMNDYINETKNQLSIYMVNYLSI